MDYELVQEEYLRNLEMTDNTEKSYPLEKLDNQDIWTMSQILSETKIDKMSNVRREIEFLERGMHRERTKLDRSQHDPIQTLSMSIIGIIEKHDSHDTDQGGIQARPWKWHVCRPISYYRTTNKNRPQYYLGSIMKNNMYNLESKWIR